MKKKTFLLMLITVLITTILIYQPPKDSHGQAIAVNTGKKQADTSTIFSSKRLNFHIDTTLMDSLRSYKKLSDSLRDRSVSQLSLMGKQQRTLSKQVDTLRELRRNPKCYYHYY